MRLRVALAERVVAFAESPIEKARSRLALADLVYTSLDGDAAAHVAARGAHAHDGVIDAIRALVAGGKPVIAICVVTEHSIGQMPFLLDQAEQLGIRMHFQPQCVDTEVVRGSVSATNERYRDFWRTLLAEKRTGRPIVSSTPYLEFLSGWEDFSVSAYHAPDVRCAAGRGYLDDIIDPRDTRPVLISALESLQGKRDKNPPKKHGNIPL